MEERSTLFDDVIKNIASHKDIQEAVEAILFEGKLVGYNPYAFETGLLYGIFTKKDGRLAIHNELFETSLYNYLLEQQHIRKLADPLTRVYLNQFTSSGRLDMEKALLKFQEFCSRSTGKKMNVFMKSMADYCFWLM